jgi:hypothetical protein
LLKQPRNWNLLAKWGRHKWPGLTELQKRVVVGTGEIDVGGQVENDSEGYNGDPELAVSWFLENIVIHLATGQVLTLAPQS